MFFPARYVPWAHSPDDNIKNSSDTVDRAVEGKGEQGWLRQPQQHGSGITAMMGVYCYTADLICLPAVLWE